MNIASNPKNKKKDSDECITKFVHVGLSPKKKKKISMFERVFIANITIRLCSRILFKVMVNFRSRLVDVFKN